MTTKKMPFEKIEETKRPYRIWDAKAKQHCVGRNFAYERNALNAALLMVRWGEVGMQLEVYDVIYGRLLGQYVRKPTSIYFARG